MERVSNLVVKELRDLIDNEYQKIEKDFNIQNKRIHHTNIYHKDWTKNSIESSSIKNVLNYLYNIETKKIISMGFISGQPGCMEQHFHVDYDGITSTYFIPLCDLTDRNGTEYLEFQSPSRNMELFEKIKEISDKYIKREQIIESFDKIGVDSSEYNFKIANSSAYSLLYLPNYVLHRGSRNNENYNKTMFQIVLQAIPDANISSKIYFTDSELDEDNNIIERLLESRSINE